MENGISRINRTYKDYKDALVEYSKRYYPDLSATWDDASVGSWLLGMNAAVADDLSYHIDRAYQETNLDSAQELSSLYALARNLGVKIPGIKGSMAEVRFTCVLPANLSTNSPDWDYAPIIKRGTKVGSSDQKFEVLDDIDFASQFNMDGVSDRTYTVNRNNNGIITGYTVSKLAVVVAGETRVYRQRILPADSKPFMEVVLPAESVMNIESVLTVDGEVINPPTYGAFYTNKEECEGMTRFFEVDSLSDSAIWWDQVGDDGRALKYKYGYGAEGQVTTANYCITKGEWKPVKHKFITEYTDNGYMKLIFGASNGQDYPNIGSSMSDFSKWQISRMINNDALGVAPEGNTTMFILYRVGGGSASNVAEGAITRITSLNSEYRGSNQQTVNAVKRTFTVTNTTPSVSGKDMPTADELRYFIKYHTSAQNRCVTLKDYVDRILMLPPKYGTPFRVGVMEENNKVAVYLLGLNYLGQLDTLLPITLVKNIERYLSRFRMINDFVEIKNGRIVNLAFQADIIIDKNYNRTDVVSAVIAAIRDYMDVNRHVMGEEIYVGDIEKEISKIDGVLNLIKLSVYNKTAEGYSQTQISQPLVDYGIDNAPSLEDSAYEIDLEATDGVLYNDGDTMMEIKNPSVDIKVRVKER